MQKPEDFVYLKDIDSTIIESMRYFSEENFLGTKVEGYKTEKLILTKDCAIALSKVQKEANKLGFSLLVYDTFRPQRAVNHFLRWSEDNTDQKMKDKYYPHIDKAKSFELGFIARRSTHSRGSTVDLTLIELGKKLETVKTVKRTLKDGRSFLYLDDNSLDMFTSFDLFDNASYHDTDLIEQKYLDNRAILRKIMKDQGFNEFRKEWWHYILNNEPYKEQYFDFEIE